MELIGAGMGRTGTVSLKAALETLGLPCYHMFEVIGKGHVGHWLDAAEGKPVDHAAVLEGYKALCDWPACFFYKDLMKIYPDAKVILTVRNPATWYESVKDTVWEICRVMRTGPWYARWLCDFFPPGPKMLPMMDAVLWRGLMQDSFGDPEAAQRRFVVWNEGVKQHVPADKLLVFEPSQGWEPLCKFLGKPVPDQPFPHLNDTQQFINMVAFVRVRKHVVAYAVPALIVAAVAGVVGVLARGRRS